MSVLSITVTKKPPDFSGGWELVTAILEKRPTAFKPRLWT